MFTITSVKAHRLLRTRLWGFFSADDVATFATAAQSAVLEMGGGQSEWFHLCNVSELRLQSQDITDAFDAVINAPRLRSRRLAVVTGNSPVRMQIRRLLYRTDGALFATDEHAAEWLFEGRSQRKSA